jgi:hypothetical protein
LIEASFDDVELPDPVNLTSGNDGNVSREAGSLKILLVANA